MLRRAPSCQNTPSPWTAGIYCSKYNAWRLENECLAHESKNGYASQEGFELVIKLSQMGVIYTQSSEAERKKLRPKYSENANS